jgi:hypothetical protein
MVEINLIVAIVAGIGIGWIAAYLVVGRPLVRLVAEMRQLGFTPPIVHPRKPKYFQEGPNES